MCCSRLSNDTEPAAAVSSVASSVESASVAEAVVASSVAASVVAAAVVLSAVVASALSPQAARLIIIARASVIVANFFIWFSSP